MILLVWLTRLVQGDGGENHLDDTGQPADDGKNDHDSLRGIDCRWGWIWDVLAPGGGALAVLYGHGKRSLAC